jgi:hypothetical protein
MLTLHGAAALVNNKSQRPAGGGGGGTGQRRAFDCKAALAMNYSPRADKTRPAASAGEARRGAARRGPQTGARRGVRPPFDYSRGCARPGPARPGPAALRGHRAGGARKAGINQGPQPAPPQERFARLRGWEQLQPGPAGLAERAGGDGRARACARVRGVCTCARA